MNVNNLVLKQDARNLSRVVITDADDYDNNEVVGQFNFENMSGFFKLGNTTKSYRTFKPLLNNFFNMSGTFAWDEREIEKAKAYAKNLKED